MIRTPYPHVETTSSIHVAEELRRVTEAAAVAAAPWIGKGDKLSADQAAVDAMHHQLNKSGLSCEVVNGEGEKDNAPELKQGTVYGDLRSPHYDLAVDPVEGTTFVSRGQDGGMSIAALGLSGDLMPWVGIPYMKKLVVGPGASKLMEAGNLNINGDPAQNMRRVAQFLGKRTTELAVAMLNRERNQHIQRAAEQIGARVLLLEGGDVTPALQACMTRDVDMLYSSGGAPEGVITAAAVAALGGNMQAMFDPQTADEINKTFQAGLLGRPLDLHTLIGDGEVHFAATGITRSPVLTGAHKVEGVWYPGSSITASRLAQRKHK